MKSIIVAAMFLSLVLPGSALSPVEQAYADGVNDGLKLGKLMSNIDAYNIAVQQFNDKINQTFWRNASLMWLPEIALNSTESTNAHTSLKPIHKMDGTPGAVTVIQY